MNLHGIVSSAINVVNPFVFVTVLRSTGYTTNPDGSRTPKYATFSAKVQVQSLTYSDLRLLDSLNIQGIRRAVYLTGEVEAIVRAQQEGGDLLVFPTGTLPEGDTWLAAQRLEAWPDWSKICITLQNNQ